MRVGRPNEEQVEGDDPAERQDHAHGQVTAGGQYEGGGPDYEGQEVQVMNAI